MEGGALGRHPDLKVAGRSLTFQYYWYKNSVLPCTIVGLFKR